MTFSYAVRAWTMEQMSMDYFGINAIATGACVNWKTVEAWFRQDTDRAKLMMKTPREYERSMGILLYEECPKELALISKLVYSKPDSLQQWKTDNYSKPLSSDLLERTFQGVYKLRTLVKEGLGEHGESEYLKNRMLWPDPRTIFERTWRELDSLMTIHVDQLFAWRINDISEEPIPEIASRRPKNFRGPHRNRYSEFNGKYLFPEQSYQKTRRVSHLSGCYRIEAYENAEIADELLGEDWGIKDEPFPDRQEQESILLDQIYKREKRSRRKWHLFV